MTWGLSSPGRLIRKPHISLLELPMGRSRWMYTRTGNEVWDQAAEDFCWRLNVFTLGFRPW